MKAAERAAARKTGVAMTRVPLVLLLCVAAAPLYAAQLTSVTVLDRDYLVVQISDGDVTHNESPVSETISRYTPVLNTSAAVSTASWTITSPQDGNYGGAGRQPTNAYRKTKLSGHGQMEWTGSDFRYEYTYEHRIFLRLPSPMQQGMTYTVTAGAATNATPHVRLRDLRHLQHPLGGGARQPRRLRRRDRPQGRRPLRVARQRRRARLLLVRGQHGLRSTTWAPARRRRSAS